MGKSNILIRPVEDSDISSVSGVIKQTLLPLLKQEGVPDEDITEILKKYNEEALTERMRGNFFLLAEHRPNKKIVGVAGLRKDDKTGLTNRLSTFYVLPEHQKQGIARMFFERIKSEAVKNGETKLVVNSRLNSEKVYEHFGFSRVRVETREYSGGRRSYHIWMELGL